MKTRKFLSAGLGCILAAVAFISLTGCSDDNPSDTPKASGSGIYRVEAEVTGNSETIAVLSFNPVKSNGTYMDNSSYIYDNIKDEKTDLTSITAAQLSAGKYSYETINKVENVIVSAGIGNSGISYFESSLKVTLFKDDKQIFTKTISSKDDIKQFTYNTAND